MGRATAPLFAKEGTRVSIVDIQDDAGRETTRKIHDAGGEAWFFFRPMPPDQHM